MYYRVGGEAAALQETALSSVTSKVLLHLCQPKTNVYEGL